MQLFDWNIAAASNNSAPPDGAPENMEYDEVNDTMREFMAVLARFYQNAIAGSKTTGGTTTAYTLTTDFSISAYAAGQVFSFVANATSTGSVTLNVDAQGAGNVVDARGVQLGAGDIVSGGFYIVRRTAAGTFMVLGALSASSIAASSGVTLTSAYLAGGTADAITITPSPAFTAYANGQMIAFRANATNTGAMTINISGLGAEALEDYRSAALAAGDVTSGRAYLAMRTGGEWRIIAGLPVDAANDLVGITPVANGGTGQSTAAAAFGALKQDATNAATGVIEHATDAEMRASTTGNLAVTPAVVESASAAVTLTDAATIAVDWDTFINGQVTLTANRVLGNPTNGQPGTWRTIYVLGNDATDRTLTFGNQYLGEVPTITDADSGRAYLLTIFCRTTSHFVVSSKKALGT